MDEHSFHFSFLPMDLLYYFLFLLPRKLVSFIVGALLHIPLPSPCAGLVINAYARYFKIDLNECDADSYSSLGAFFCRELGAGARPIGGPFVSPVDGTLREAGRIEGGALPQVKGVSYTVEALLADAGRAPVFNDGLFFNLYLSPRDYHHVHSPISGGVVCARYVPGHLWPVNSWSLSHINGVFAQNERVITYIESAWGLVAVVMVGAFNVGRISVSYDTFETNRVFNRRRSSIAGQGERSTCSTFSAAYFPPKEIAVGEKLGTFHLGSSVIVLVEASSRLCDSMHSLRASGNICYGEALIEVHGSAA